MTWSTKRVADRVLLCVRTRFLRYRCHTVLDREKWKPVLTVARERLLTPYGLRSLAHGEPDYKPRYDGDLLARDAAYHQGTV